MPALAPIAPGAFAAPPRSGVSVGATRSSVVNGLRLRFPALVIELPSLELPSFSRCTRAQHMRIDEATAPFVANPNYTRALLYREAELRALRDVYDRSGKAERGAKDDEADAARSADISDVETCRKELEALRQALREMERCLNKVDERLRGTDAAPLPEEIKPMKLPPCPPKCPVGMRETRRTQYEFQQPPAPESAAAYFPPTPVIRRLPAAD